ncbi:MAG: methylmalonyl Co-A mutase-associated GTPase MeaB [Candidatus Pelagadaptatus aseana]|uniref:methylmalonyl Co-A mutase-associated GTPase MeaB n=1 Tax=Candidatus Pelagadaptatus aseana TaxID=3120508 RepID=UPI0039B2E87E
MPSIDLDRLKQGNRRALAKAITLVESKLDSHRMEAQQVLESILPHTGNSIRIGITGIPGVGKSTFIESFGLHLIEQGKKVAVLAVDPSSPIRGGSILGDKTRMEELSRQENAFIRPSPSEGTMGGVAQKTRETMLLCEAAGYDVIIVETVGVGQSEYEVAAMVDFFLVLMIPNAGDELQGIKRGIMELADSLVINKADGESINLAQRTRQHYQNAFHLIKGGGFWNPRVLTCSAMEKSGIDDVWNMISEYRELAIKNQAFDEKRSQQNSQWLQKLIHELLEMRLHQNPDVQQKMPSLFDQVIRNKVTPYSAARQIVDLL